MKINTVTRWKHRLRRMIQQGAPDLGAGALTVQSAQALTERHDPTDLLPYIDFEDGYVVRDDGTRPQIGFILQFQPVMVAGKDMEQQIESVITRAPADTVIQFAAHSAPAIEDRVGAWMTRRMRYNREPVLKELVQRRTRHMMRAAGGVSLLPNERLYPREVQYFVSFTLTYRGDPEHAGEIRSWRLEADEFRASVIGTFQSMGLGPVLLEEAAVRRLLRRLANPQMIPGELDDRHDPRTPFRSSVFERRTRLRVEPTGVLGFSDPDREAAVVPVTVDGYPDMLRLYMTGELLGDVLSPSDRIAPAYWLHTTIHKPDPEAARDAISMRLGLISKQCMSDSEWYKGMMPHLFQRRNDTQRLLNQTRGRYCPVRMWTGINLITEPERAASDADYVTALWRKAGYRASRERYISLPVWLGSLPWGYNPAMDLPTGGLQRAQMVSSLNGACAAICQGDWGGNGPVIKATRRTIPTCTPTGCSWSRAGARWRASTSSTAPPATTSR